ncbi:NYN domain-containing protein [Devosia sp. Root635]|uniref:NYN domain-containing protein n=1 Tax=Devosia sp. Root635 TaxID=1736575 RepID=UPI0006FC49AE|nr:NYN domain-containing protein [Devosia sp. Root635]KRA47685.1 hypothetical protein ASD80_02465 [Devosia sp. Root635]
MTLQQIAVLFDAENIDCVTAGRALNTLAARGRIVVMRAVGDFSAATLSNWVECARAHGIELVMQPGLGKGKNAADIRLTIEAMDIAHAGKIDTMALVTHDRDFTPLALRLRNAGLTVLGMGRVEPSATFRAACSAFELFAPMKPMAEKAIEAIQLDKGEMARLQRAVATASKQGPISPVNLTRAIIAAEPALATRLSGRGKFLKTLVAHGLAERVGSGPEMMVQAPRLRDAG